MVKSALPTHFSFRMLSVVPVLILVVAACSGSPIAPIILGGSDADIADFPYIVNIESNIVGHYCGGVIINANWVLTDAWCTTEPAHIMEFSVYSGSAFVGNGTEHSVVQWIHHPQNDVQASEYDFALVQVDPPFEFGENVAVVALPSQEQGTPDGAEALIAGWGQVDSSPNWVHEQLQSATITVLNEATCSELLAAEFQNSKLCAHDPNGQAVHCYRDEGGPLVVDGTLFGIVQWFGGCADPQAVHVYSRVASVRTWIDETTAA